MAKPKIDNVGIDALGMTSDDLKKDIAQELTCSVGADVENASEREWYNALSNTVRNRLMARWVQTQKAYEKADAKKVYYLSLEFLIGRSLMNAAINLDLDEPAAKAMKEIGLSLDEIRECEWDAALGNGGLGRLAACFIDSMATLQLPGFGYGIRYDYGLFAQEVGSEGQQKEKPDNWLRYKNAWETKREEVNYTVNFGGRVVSYKDEDGRIHYDWVDTKSVQAVAYDTPIPGNKVGTVNHLRLWSGEPTNEFDFASFNRGEYQQAVAEKNSAQNLSQVLYPDDTTEQGKELRMKQQYFHVCASLQDILRDYLATHDNFDNLADKVAIQLNDTHPTLAIPELMRIMVDIYRLEWSKAWGICNKVFAYTCHTLLPEALETWPVRMFEKLLPRHLEIIFEINRRFLAELSLRFPNDIERMQRMSILDDHGEQRIRMANLAIIGSHKVNGVAELHSHLMKTTIFKDFDQFYPGKLTNVTNGVTPRRWLKEANPELAKLYTGKIGSDWENNLPELDKISEFAKDAKFQKAFAKVKRDNKKHLAYEIKETLGIEVSEDSMFDVQVKRIHEYKRQLLQLLHVIARYNRIRNNPEQTFAPRTVIIAGKAAPGYVMAKRVVKLINNVARIINNDPAIGDKLKLVYMPNYNCSMAQDIMPAADLSEQISTAGMEASGTGNMKLALNGALTIGTLDGANVEIKEEVGDENIFIFGLTADEVAETRSKGYYPQQIVDANPELSAVLSMISNGFFSEDDPSEFKPIVDTLVSPGEHFLCLADFNDYMKAQFEVDALYLDQKAWIEKAIINSAKMGKFSSDRSIQDYVDRVWGIEAISPLKKAAKAKKATKKKTASA
jgi:starch phosphorylase